MIKKAAAPRPGFVWACALAAAAAYVVLGPGGLVAAVVCMSCLEVARRCAGAKPKGAAAVLAVLAALPLLAACLAGGAFLVLGLFLDLCYAIIHPALFFSLLFWSGLVYAAWRALRRFEKPPAALRVLAGAAVFLGLAMSPESWQRLRAAEQSRPSKPTTIFGWRFRFNGPEGGLEKPRFYVKTQDPAKPYRAVEQCPDGTKPYPAERVEGGALCR
ncbi:MAG: hypothetical protein NTY77_04125 [Elusimicrobia bacterium]|nr:hypothetical protein [Elusimicrobiota bacterium]